MRRLVLKMECSLDGFVCGPRGEIDWLAPGFDSDHGQWMTPRLWSVGSHVMGRTTYLGMAAHWPASNQTYAAPMNQIPKLVFSGTLRDAPWGPVTVLSGDPASELARLKQEPGRDLLMHGGAQLARTSIPTGLIDEYWLVVHPVALGRGLALFQDLAAPMRLRVHERTAFPSGVTAMVLRPV